MLFSLLTNILLVIISLANCGYGSLAVSCTIQLLFGGWVWVPNQQIALSEFPMGRFLVPPQHTTLSKIPMGRFLCNKPACCFVRITKGAILCAKPCQNSQWGDSVCQTMSEFPMGWFCVPNQHTALSEFPMGWFCVPNHVRISNGLCTLCTLN